MTSQYPPPYVPFHSQPSLPGMQGPPAPKKSRRWPWFVGGVAIVLCFGACTNATHKAIPPYNAPAVSPTYPPSEVKPVTTGPATTFGDGTWVVGEDIVAGTYKSPGANEGIFDFCVVSTYADDTGEGHVLAMDTANAHEPMRIKVSGNVKSVKAAGCAAFTKV